jgi:FAD/FMN-containing dehydrogenase
VVLFRTAEDVVEAVAFARRWGIEVAVRSGGHDFAGRSSGPGMVLDLTLMHSLEVSDGLATVGPGFRLGDLYVALAQHGVTIPAGCGATVGIGGQALGGGLGLLGRSLGLTSDQIVAAKVVLADGRVAECDDQRHEDLFWALRGAGAQGFGVVTRLTLRTVPEPAATSFHLKWPYQRASALVAAWQDWSPTGPDGLAPVCSSPSRERRRPVVFVRLDDRQSDRDRGAARRVRVGRPRPTSSDARTCATAG